MRGWGGACVHVVVVAAAGEGNISVGVLVAGLLGQRPPPAECEK